jgi:hypothetical protein
MAISYALGSAPLILPSFLLKRLLMLVYTRCERRLEETRKYIDAFTDTILSLLRVVIYVENVYCCCGSSATV